MPQSTYLKTRDSLWIKGTNYSTAPTAGSGLRISLHSADPLLTGVNEIAFARIVPTTYGAIATLALLRQFPINESLTFVNSPITGSATHWGSWDAATGGNFLGGGQFLDSSWIPASIALTAANDVTIASGTIRFAYQRGVFSDYFIDAKLNWLKGTAFPTAPASIRASLGTGLQSDGTGTNSGLARQPVSWGADTTILNYIRVANSAQVAFSAPASALTLDSAGFHDALTAGNLLWVGRFSSRLFAIGEIPLWGSGAINVDF